MGDKLYLGWTFTSAAASIICKEQSEQVVVELPLYILCRYTLDELVNITANNMPCIISEE